MTPFDLELELRREAVAMRAMARDLLRDDHAVEDVLQEAVCTTLTQAPSRPGSLGGWLTTVLRNLCFQHRRGEQRRRQREQIAARPERVAATADLAARREILRRVTDAVFALDEPYQSAILLRYFEDLSPGQIAQRTQTAVATVKSRLQRGLLLLRARLDGHHRDRNGWRRALAMATGLRAVTTTTTLIATGAVLMGPTAKLSLVAAGLLAGAALAWNFVGANAPEVQTSMHAKAEGPATAAMAAAIEQPAAGTERVAVPTAEVVTSDLVHPFEFDLQVEVIDRDGLPVPNAQLHVAPAGCSLDKYMQVTGEDGAVHVQFRGKKPAMEIVLAVEGQRSLRRLVVQSGAPRRIVLEGQNQQQGQVHVSFTIAGGKGSTGRLLTTDGFKLRLDNASATTDLATRELAELVNRRSTLSDLMVRQGLHPHACFADALLSPPQHDTESNTDVEVSGQTLFFTRSLGVESFAIVDGSLTARDSETKGDEPPPTILEGLVYGEDGKPVPHCTVAWGTDSDRPQGRMQTDDQGAFRFDSVTAGWLELRAGGGDGGLRHARVLIAAGKTTHWETRLERQARIVGKAIDQDGKPLAGWRVELVGAGGPYFDACTVHEDGSFELPNHPGGPGTLLLWHRNRAAKLPVLVEPTVLPDNGEVLLRLHKDAAASQMQIEPVLPDGMHGVAAEVRVWQEETDRGASMEKAENSNLYSLANLPAGWYHVEIGATALGWIDAGRHWVDGKGLTNLGRVQLPQPGKLHITRAASRSSTDEPPASEIYLRRPDCDVRAEDTKAITADELPLPAGDYWFLWRDADQALRHVPFTIRAGNETGVECLDRDVQSSPSATSAPGRERR